MAVTRRASASFPRQWNPAQVPTWPVELDQTHPLARGLVGLWTGGNPNATDLVTGVVGTSSGVSAATSPAGPALAFSSSNSYVSTGEIGTVSNWAGDFTFCVIAQPQSSFAAYPGLIAGAIGNPYFYIDGPSHKPSLDKRAVVNIGQSPFSLNLDTTYHLAVSYSPTTGAYAFYVNGAPQGSGTNIQAFAGGGTVYLGNQASASAGLIGLYIKGQIHSRILTPAEVLLDSAEPFALLRPVVRRQYYTAAASSSVTVALTQQAGTGTIGSLATGRTEALAQVAATGNVGTITAVVGVTAALSQVSGTGTVGTIAPSQAVTLAQQAGTGTVGTLTAGRAATLAQQAGTGTVGSPVESVSIGLAQVSATGNVGTVTAIVGVTAALSQVAGTGTVGAVVASTSVGVAQTAAAGTIGSIAPSRSAALAQTAGTGTVGTATPGASVGLVEVAGVGTVGSVAATAGSNVTVSLTQQSATGAVGTITASVPVTVSLSQVAAAGTIGALAPSGAVGVTQAAGTGTVGTITAVSGAVTVALSQQAATGTVGSLAWARSLGLGHLIGTGAVGALTPGGVFIPSVRRTLTLTASARTIAASRLSRTIIIP